MHVTFPPEGAPHVNGGPDFCVIDTNVVAPGIGATSDAFGALSGPSFWTEMLYRMNPVLGNAVWPFLSETLA